MTKKFTLFGMMLLLSVVSVFASGFELPKVDVARQQKMAAEVNTDLMMRPRGSVNSPFAKTPSLKMQKKQTSAFDMMREAEAPASNIYGLQVYNTDDIYDSWWKLDVATAKSTVQWSNEYLGAYNYNAGFVRKGIVYAITIETGYISSKGLNHETIAIAEAIGKATANGAFSLIGGGDSVACINKFGMADQVSYISTGGGALLEAIEGKVLLGVAAIKGE